MELIPLMLIRVAGLPADTLDPLRGEYLLPENALKAADARLNGAKEALLQALSDWLQRLPPDSEDRQAVYRFRAVLYEKNKLSADINRLEMPAHIRILAEQFEESLHEQAGAAQALADLYEANLSAGMAHVQILAAGEHLQHALGYAAPDLLQRLPELIQKPVESWLKKDRQRAFSLLQYIARACFKTSPFSRLTTVCLSPQGPLPEEVWSIPKPVATPNVVLLPFVYEVLLQDAGFLENTPLRLNPSFKKLHDGRVRWLYFNGDQEAFQEMAAHEAVDFVTDHLQGREFILFADLKRQLTALFAADDAQISHFLNELIALGLLEINLPETGLTAQWSAGLYQRLGAMPASPAIVSAAMTLQWLRTAARNLPHITIGEAVQSRSAAVENLAEFGRQQDLVMPDIPPHHVFLEDVAWSAGHALPEAALLRFAGDIQELWQQCGPVLLPPAKAKALTFAGQLNHGEPVSFLDMARAYTAGPGFLEMSEQFVKPYPGKIGALLQPFLDGKAYRAVVNALYPGGGKLAARWLHLFPDPQRAVLEQWMKADEPNSLPFPWHGWNNAVFQPADIRLGIDVPGGRMRLKESIPLSDVLVHPDGDGPWLSDRRSGRRFWLIDRGVEAVGAKPPVMQLLWHLGTPYVSLTPLLKGRTAEMLLPGWVFLPQVAHGSVVLARREWRIDQSVWHTWLTRKAGGFFFYLRELFREMYIPDQVFIQFSGEKPQYFDLNSPLFVQLLERTLRKSSGVLAVHEMLPGPDQSLLRREGKGYVGEWVCEFGR